VTSLRPLGQPERKKLVHAPIGAVDLPAHAMDMAVVAIIQIQAEEIKLVAGLAPGAPAKTQGRLRHVAIIEPQFLAQQFFKSTDFFRQIFNHTQMVAIQPADDANHQESKRIHRHRMATPSSIPHWPLPSQNPPNTQQMLPNANISTLGISLGAVG
jgi:hypothetical protein